MGAVLYQDLPESRNIISYASAKFSPVEARYSRVRYRPQLESAPFILKTDERAIVWLQNSREANKKLSRWARFLDTFQYEV